MRPDKLDKLLNRKKYKEIKTMDRQQMAEFVTYVYQEGFTDGVEAVPDAKTVTESKLLETIIQVKGIGEKKAELILQEIRPLVDVVEG